MQRAKQSRFTLFEITFVMAMIFLLATLVVMGQHLTTDLRVSRLDHDLHSIQTAIYDSQDRIRPMHSNLHKASSHLTDTAAFGNNSNWNSIVGENWEPTSGETFNLWQNVRPAGFAQGSMGTNSNAYVPLKSSGGIISVSKASNAPIAGLKGSYIICTNNIAGGLVKQLDHEMDDGNTASGSMMVSNAIGGTGISTDSIVDSSTYMVCLGV